MKKEDYFRIMGETASIVNPFVDGALNYLKDLDQNLYDSVSKIHLRRKARRGSARSLLFRAAYETAVCSSKEEGWKDLAYLAAAYEILIYGIYYANSYYDDKSISLSNPKAAINASRICRNLAEKLILDNCRSLSHTRLYIQEIVSSDLNTEIGQFIDVFENNFRKIRPSFEESLDLYLRRTKLVNAYLMGSICKVAAESTVALPISAKMLRDVSALTDFGINYGIAMQIVNDIGDYVSSAGGTVEKEPSDNFSDIKHKKLTLPLIHGVFNSTGKTSSRLEEIIEKGSFDDHELKELTLLLLNAGSFEFSKKIARQYAANAITALNIFPDEKRSIFASMLSMTESNRYYNSLDLLTK